MSTILIAGAGKIGTLVAALLADCGDYQIVVADNVTDSHLTERIAGVERIKLVACDINNKESLTKLVREHQIEAVISCLPYFLNIAMAELAAELEIHYFDLTEDTTVTSTIKQLAKKSTTAFVPQCGLAPGFVSVVANSLMQEFNEVETVKLRVGALPQNSSNSLCYAMTWSTDGLINQYGNPCQAILRKEATKLTPLAGLEHVQIDGWSYEAFNTSGGLGSLAELWLGKVTNMTYKTLRYPGHCEKMRILMEELKLNSDRETLKHILENAIPKTEQDVVLIYVSVTGIKDGDYLEKDFVKKVYPQTLLGQHWSAIQITTASACCATFDMFFQGAREKGFIYQENYALSDFLANRFAACYR